MHLESLLDLHFRCLIVERENPEKGAKEFEALKSSFNENYKIVPKEQWCVGITTSGSYNHEVGIQGPFNTEMEAKLFADIWNRKRDEFIDKTISESDDPDVYIPYLKANAYKLEITDKNQSILDEMIQTIEAGINKIQNEDLK